MQGRFQKLGLLALLSSACMGAYAQGEAPHIIVAPNCLIDAAKNVKLVARQAGLSLVSATEAGVEELVELKHQKKCGGFMDVTHAWDTFHPLTLSSDMRGFLFLSGYHPDKQKLTTAVTKEYGIHYSAQVDHLIGKLNPDMMWHNLSTLTSFKDRYANSSNGVEAANWIKAKVEKMASDNNRQDVSAFFVKTGNAYKQPSLVVKFGNSNEPGIVIGGHMDTLSSGWEDKPGADDDGSGTVTVLEVARTIMSSGMEFKKPIYFIWYAAEEMGLVGSGFVVDHFKKHNIPVDAVIQMDMTGYAHKNERTMWLIGDHVDKSLTSYLETLIQTYVKQEVKYTACGYACSDHASWTQGGFAASMPSESKFDQMNPDIHSSSDQMSNLSLVHMTDYAKLALSFAVELAEPSK